MEMYALEVTALKGHKHCRTERPKQLRESERCSTIAKSSTSTSADSVGSCVRILIQIVLIAYMLQAQINGCLGCRDDQVTWRGSDKAQNDRCFDCIDCPDGMEPSIPCGTAAKFGTHLECLVCRDGTFSNNYGKQQCMPCSLCSVGRTVARNCSSTKNTRCGPCMHGYYMDYVVLGCLPCSICCWDSRDRFETACKAQGLPRHRQCSPRHEDSCQPLASTAKAHPGGNDAIAVPTVQQRSSQSQTTLSLTSSANQEMAIIGSTAKSDDNDVPSSVPTTGSELQKQTTKGATHSNEKAVQPNHRKSGLVSHENKKRIIMGLIFGTVTLLFLVAIAKRNKIAHYLKWLKCRPKCRSKPDVECSEPTEGSTLEDIRVPIPVEVKGDPLRLCQLKSISLDAYESIWKRLDKQPEGTNKGDFRAVANEFGLVQEDIWELEKEFKVPGSGSPSRQLLECLEAKWPELTVVDFIEVLRKPNIDRNDIVDILKDYLYK